MTFSLPSGSSLDLKVPNFKGEVHSNGTFIHLANKNKYCKLTSLLSQTSRLFTNNILK